MDFDSNDKEKFNISYGEFSELPLLRITKTVTISTPRFENLTRALSEGILKPLQTYFDSKTVSLKNSFWKYVDFVLNLPFQHALKSLVQAHWDAGKADLCWSPLLKVDSEGKCNFNIKY